MDELTQAITDQQTPIPEQGRVARRLVADQAERAQPAPQSAPSSLSRAERRRLDDAELSAARARSSLWRAWWVYVLIAAVGGAVFLGVRSAAEAPAPQPVVTTVPDR